MFIKEVQHHQLKHLIAYATCDEECKGCDWKDEFYNQDKYDCLLKQLRDIIHIEKEIIDDSKLDYLKRKDKSCE